MKFKIKSEDQLWVDSLPTEKKAILGSLLESAMGAMHLSFAAKDSERDAWDVQQFRWMKFAKKLQGKKC